MTPFKQALESQASSEIRNAASQHLSEEARSRAEKAYFERAYKFIEKRLRPMAEEFVADANRTGFASAVVTVSKRRLAQGHDELLKLVFVPLVGSYSKLQRNLPADENTVVGDLLLAATLSIRGIPCDFSWDTPFSEEQISTGLQCAFIVAPHTFERQFFSNRNEWDEFRDNHENDEYGSLGTCNIGFKPLIAYKRGKEPRRYPAPWVSREVKFDDEQGFSGLLRDFATMAMEMAAAKKLGLDNLFSSAGRLAVEAEQGAIRESRTPAEVARAEAVVHLLMRPTETPLLRLISILRKLF